MHRIEGFWVGARAHARGGELSALATRMDGLDRMSSATLADLLAVGVSEGRARAWMAAVDASTLGRPVRWIDESYPDLLRHVPDAPAVLCVEGSLDAWKSPCVAIVGTRSCSGYGVAVARHLSEALSARGVGVVSGLARGIDAHAHRAALERGRTVAVLGHGLGTTSPPSHRALRREIIDSGGIIVSAYPDDLGPARWSFPQRNKWIAGIAEATVVVEAPIRSGALITAAEAAGIGREVFAVPAPLGNPWGAGCLALLAAGASIIDDVESFADRYGSRRDTSQDPWLHALSDAPTAEMISRRLALPVHVVQSRMMTLELEGRVVRLPGGRFSRA
jgi:DNA processing protein